MDRLFFHHSIDTDWECFGHFDIFNTFCKKKCALRLGCLVMHGKMARQESLNAWPFDEPLPMKIQ